VFCSDALAVVRIGSPRSSDASCERHRDPSGKKRAQERPQVERSPTRELICGFGDEKSILVGLFQQRITLAESE
jgi:hypothetical protein